MQDRQIASAAQIAAIINESIQALVGWDTVSVHVLASQIDEHGCNWIAQYQQPREASPSMCVLVIELIGNTKREFNLP